MSPWFSVLIIGLALLVGVFALCRRSRPGDQIAPDSTTQVAALRALLEPGAQASPEHVPAPVPDAAPHEPVTIPAEHLSVRAETQRTLRELAFGTPMPIAAPQDIANDEIHAL